MSLSKIRSPSAARDFDTYLQDALPFSQTKSKVVQNDMGVKSLHKRARATEEAHVCWEVGIAWYTSNQRKSAELLQEAW